MNFLVELFDFAKTHKKLWIMPIMIFIVLLGGLIVLAQGSAIAPFIYAVF